MAETFWCLCDMVQASDPEFGTYWTAWVAVNYQLSGHEVKCTQSDPNSGAPVHGFAIVKGLADSKEVDRMVLDAKVNMISRGDKDITVEKLSETPLRTAGVLEALQERGVPVAIVSPTTTVKVLLDMVSSHIYGRNVPVPADARRIIR